MNKDWTLPEEFYKALHRWPSMIGFFILGCLIGLLSAYLWPTSHRAIVQIYVGFNPYRAFSDAVFEALANPKYSNVDDYKHWQMSQLETVIFIDSFLQDTLTRLRQQDSYWEQINLEQLHTMLYADWRSAGTWSLTAEHPQSNYASQAASAWSETILEKVPQAIQAAQTTFMLDQEHQETRLRLMDAQLRLRLLNSTKTGLQSWLQDAQTEAPEQVLETQARWELLSQVASLAEFTPAWISLLESQPIPDAPISEYIVWVSQVLTQMDTDLAQLPELIRTLENASKEMEEQYTLMNQASFGLSPNLTIENVESLPTKTIRPTSTLVLVGGVVGLCLWVLWQITRISRREYSQ